MNREPENDSGPSTGAGDETPSPRTYEFQILLDRDSSGTVSAVAMNLPGAGSCGDTDEEALQNVRAAIRGLLDEYKAGGMRIPWTDATGVEIPEGARTQWITVDA